MATSVSRIHAQIAKLQQQADALKEAAVKRVQREIALHGLTAEDLFGSGTSVGNGRRAKAGKAAKVTGGKAAKVPKYGDSAGNTWGGMGKRPQWLRDALEQGASLTDFLLEAGNVQTPSGGLRVKQRKTAATTVRRAAKQPSARKKLGKQPAQKAAVKRKAKSSVGQADTVAA